MLFSMSWKSLPAVKLRRFSSWTLKILQRLLPALAGHPRIALGKSSEVGVSKVPFVLPVRATLQANGEIVLALKEKAGALVMIGDWVWGNSTLQPLALPPGLKDIVRGPVRIARLQVPAFLNQQWPQLQASGAVEANFKLEDFTVGPQAPRFLLELRGGLAQLGARLQCAYGSRIMTVGVTDREMFGCPTRMCQRAIRCATLARSGPRSHDCNARDFPRRTLSAKCNCWGRMRF